jgi:lantibiotic modifying enzyme
VEASPSRRWQPVLHGADAGTAWRTIRLIAEALRPSGGDSVTRQPGLAGGWAGIGLFYGALAAATDDAMYRDAANVCLDRAIRQFSAVPPSPAFFTDVLGCAWVLDVLTEQLPSGIEPCDTEDVLHFLDDSLDSRSPHDPFDLVYGTVGIGVCALQRSGPDALRRVERVVELLAASARPVDGGLTWWTNPRWLPPERADAAPKGYYDTGLAHGVAGVICFLAAALESGVHAAAEPLRGAVDWLSAQRHDGGEAWFPQSVPVSGKGKPAGRIAWCYGDLGVAVALQAASRALVDGQLALDATRIAHQAAVRPLEARGIVDAGLCHGHAGVGHVLQRLSQDMPDPALEQAARASLNAATAARGTGQAAGYIAMKSARDGSPRLVPEPECALLEGAAGIGLALLAGVCDAGPRWDSFLLLGLPGGRGRPTMQVASQAPGGLRG